MIYCIRSIARLMIKPPSATLIGVITPNIAMAGMITPVTVIGIINLTIYRLK